MHINNCKNTAYKCTSAIENGHFYSSDFIEKKYQQFAFPKLEYILNILGF